MEEVFLHYLWRFRLFNPELRTTSGEEVVVIHPGTHNTNSGPDFINARIRIGGTTWAGNVEIHKQSSDWFRHRHHLDPSYDNVILHVVYRYDPETGPMNILTVELDGQFPAAIGDKYTAMMQNCKWIPCSHSLGEPLQQEFSLWNSSLVIERLERKCVDIRLLWEACDRNWEECFYRFLSSGFGFRLNSLPFELLAGSLPLKYLMRNSSSRTLLEALLYGQAGMLEEKYRDQYPLQLKREFRYLSEKYRLSTPAGIQWRFMRLRPSNFPTLRISQFASLIQSTGGRLYQFIESHDMTRITETLNLSASSYWDEHFMFDRYSPKKIKLLGEGSKLLLVINVIVPFLFFVGLENRMNSLCDKSLQLLESLKGEINPDVTRWRVAGFETGDAFKTQALLQLKRAYCDRKRCLECRLGLKILSKIY